MTPSIKNNECDIRAQGLDRHWVYGISGAVQKRSTNFLGVLRNNQFQHAIIKLLVGLWENNANANIIQDVQIHVTCGNQCFSFKTEDEKVRKLEKTYLKCPHKEVDSRMLFTSNSYTPQKNLPKEQLIQIF